MTDESSVSSLFARDAQADKLPESVVEAAKALPRPGPLVEIKPGDRIWRPVYFSKLHSREKVISKYVAAQRTDRGTYILRAQPARHHVDPLAIWAQPPWYEDNGRRTFMKGLIIFLQGQLPEDWIYLVVTSASRGGNCIFAEPVRGAESELLSAYEWREGTK